MKATIKKPDGTIIELEGTKEEVDTIINRTKPVVPFSPYLPLFAFPTFDGQARRPIYCNQRKVRKSALTPLLFLGLAFREFFRNI